MKPIDQNLDKSINLYIIYNTIMGGVKVHGLQIAPGAIEI